MTGYKKQQVTGTFVLSTKHPKMSLPCQWETRNRQDWLLESKKDCPSPMPLRTDVIA